MGRGIALGMARFRFTRPRAPPRPRLSVGEAEVSEALGTHSRHLPPSQREPARLLPNQETGANAGLLQAAGSLFHGI